MSTLSISLVPGALPQDGDQITNSVLRALGRPTIQLAGSVGTATVDDGAITTAKLADGALSADTTGRGKMADGFVTAAKLASDAVTTLKILDANVTAAKASESFRGDVQQYGAATMKSITLTTLTRSGTTATATKVAHGFTAGQTVTVSGATPAGFNLTAVIAVPTADTFTYTLAVDPGSNATGTITAINNEYVLTLDPAPAALTAGQVLRFKADVTNTGPLDVNPNALGPKNVFTRAGKELVAGQVPAGMILELTYDGTQFQCDLRSRYASSVALPAAGSQTQYAHGLGVEPTNYRLFLKCVTADTASAYAVGDKIPSEFVTGASFGPLFTATADATNINVRRNSNASVFFMKKDTGAAATAPTSVANFELLVTADL